MHQDVQKATKQEHQAELLKALTETNFQIKDACSKVGISRETYYDWLADDPKFAEAAARVEQDLFTIVEDALKSQAIRKEPWAIKFFLARRHPLYRSKVELSSAPEFTLDHDQRDE